MDSGAVLFFYFLNRPNLPTKCSKLGKFLLDCLQPFKPLAVRELNLAFARVFKAIFLIHSSNVRDLTAETCNLLPKNVKKMIHMGAWRAESLNNDRSDLGIVILEVSNLLMRVRLELLQGGIWKDLKLVNEEQFAYCRDDCTTGVVPGNTDRTNENG